MNRSLARAVLAFTLTMACAVARSWNDPTHFQMAKLAAMQVDGSSPWGSYDFDRNLFQTDSGFGLRMYTQVGGKTLLDWFADGCADEDHQFLGGAPIYHFYNPVTNTGLSDGVPQCADSMHWAYNGSGGSTFWNEYSWVMARRYQLKALTASTPAARKQAAAAMFECLGHVAHLVQDLSQPQHTRNDAHKDEYDNHNGIEAFVSDRIHTVAELRAELRPVPNVYLSTPVALSQIDPQIPIEFQAIWDTEDYRGQNNFVSVLTGQESVFPGRHGLAEFTNFNYVSRDTLFTSPEDSIMTFPGIGTIPYFNDRIYSQVPDRRTFQYPKFRHTNLDVWSPGFSSPMASLRAAFDPVRDFSFLVEAHDPQGFTTFDFLIGQKGNTGYVWIDDLAFGSMADELLATGIDYSWLLLKQFFRGYLDYLSVGVDDGYEKGYHRLSAVSRFAEASPSAEHPTWSLYQTNRSGTRWPVHLGRMRGDGLPTGGGFDFKFYPKPWLGDRYVLVFNGKLGTEREAVVPIAFGVKQSGIQCVASDGYEGKVDCTILASNEGLVDYQSPTMSIAWILPAATSKVWGNTGQAVADDVRILDKRGETARYARGKLTVRMGDSTDNRDGEIGSDTMYIQFQGTFEDDATPCNWANSAFSKGAVFPTCMATN